MTELFSDKIDPIKIFEDVRGKHTKFFWTDEGRINTSESFPVKEIFMTVNRKDVIRGMHFQGEPQVQEKILTCVQGSARVVLVCMDKESPLYGRAEVKTLSFPSDSYQIFVPKNYALGYRILEEDTKMLYIANGDFSPESDSGFSPLTEGVFGLFLEDGETEEDLLGKMILSDRDKGLPVFEDLVR